MQNSAVMAVRATVLLVCLVAVPVAAICGKQAPEFVKSLIQDFTGTPSTVASNQANATDAPAFRPGLITVAAAPAASAAAPATLPSAGVTVPGPRGSLGGAMSPGGEGAVPSQFAGAQSGASQPSNLERVAGGPINDPHVAQAAHQIGGGDRLRQNGERSPRSDLPASESKATGFAPGYFQTAEMRLRELGATYYLLETLGPTADEYRFVCKVPSGARADEMLAFFSVDRDPLGAMNNVVRQVESWRSHLHESPAKLQQSGN
jgi:hypothetical protein